MDRLGALLLIAVEMITRLAAVLLLTRDKWYDRVTALYKSCYHGN